MVLRQARGRRCVGAAVGWVFVALSICVAGCGGPAAVDVAAPLSKLSDYKLFAGNGSSQEPLPGVIPYDLNTPLFSDYTDKYRFVKLPEGQSAVYSADEAFDFPVGTVIAKTFAYPHDARDPSQGRRLLETRILKRDADGWVGLPYIWNADQTEAVLEVAGDTIDATWIDDQGETRTNNYIVPNVNQCKGCHKQGEDMQPLGPKARNLNRDFAYAGGTHNQLAYWTKHHVLKDAPEPAEAPRLAVWNDSSTGSLDERARAWLEANCAHCHNPKGPARNSGLDLLVSQQASNLYGIIKTPVAAGRGTGGHDYDIVPAQPEQSILTFRISSLDPGIMMPELGKRMTHREGVELVREWIAAMPPAEPPLQKP
jgi:uncharacterized repeat protein (TIGR03806 family)